MKASHIAALLVCAGLFSQAASAQNIRWNNVTSNAPAPVFTPPSISFTTIGDNTYGSDGSSSYRNGNNTINSNGTSSYSTGNLTTGSDGTHTQMIGDTLYGQRPDGSQFYCRLQGGQTVCNPR